MNLASILVALLASSDPSAPPSAATVTVRMHGFRNADGQVLIAVFRGEDGWPGAPDKAWKKLVARVDGARASVVLRDVPPGEYAISVVHDENGNNTLDKSWIGIPKEGIGMSNDARARMGPPKYRDAKFSVDASGATQSITMVYF